MTAVVVLAKECLPGRVKTRLCPPFTAADAAAIAAASLADTLTLVRRMPVDRRVLAFDGNPDFDTSGFEVRPQDSGALDLRIGAVLDDFAEPVLLLGMDTPHLRMSDVEAVFRSWEHEAAVEEAWLGPASDGGFWALAMGRPDGEAVHGIPMSRADTGARVHAHLLRRGYRVRMLPTRTDIDDVYSLRRVLPAVPPEGNLHKMFRHPDAGALLLARLTVDP
ncbi:TIGR04282 family arsenosugar biosynthesis glycosyltransferase [Microbacterium mangrovi]|uniref:TIGR04282 family arsenosugar biosynthesis glycosyltransferase n=1 Tax=Microbacterium mangrovi TaxID=1348253 RepID=UPI0009DF8A93|nr:DUF2064 domain-containing protein [Microbacterium mangrovi]